MIKILLITFAIAISETLLLIRVRYNRLVKQLWRSLKVESSNTLFTPEMVADLDEPVQRYFLHAIAPGTPLATYVELEMSGNFRLKPDADWIAMEAAQIISTAPGFVWKANIGKGLNQFSGADYYSQGQGRMRFSLQGLIPLVDAQNENINRSGIGRLAGEYSWLPSALLPQNGVIWKAICDRTIEANFNIDGEPITLTLIIDNEGKLLKIFLLRWGDGTEKGDWQYIPFGGEVRAEKTFNGYTIPSQIMAGWWFDTDKYSAFFQATITKAQFNS